MNRADAMERAVKELKSRQNAKTALETILASLKDIEQVIADDFTSRGLDSRRSAELASRCMQRMEKEARWFYDATASTANSDIDTLVKHYEECVNLADVG